jgi:hypothetical protein
VVAVKLLRPSRCGKRFISELSKRAEATFILEHRGLVRSLGCEEEPSRIVLLMDYAPGEPLAKALKHNQPLSLTRALLIALQCGNALHYAALHKLHHGRLHPGDIILGEDHPRIVGVGLGERPEHAAWSEPEGAFFEPLAYIAPEAMPSQPFPESVGGRAATDLYSLGAILFHALTGQPPFKGTDEGALDAERKFINAPVVWPTDKKDALPADVVALVDRMMSPKPAARLNFEQLGVLLKQALTAAEKAEAAKAPPQALPPSGFRGGVRTAVGTAPAASPGAEPLPGTPVLHVGQPVPPSGAAQWGYSLPQAAKPSALTRAYTALLVGMTAVVFIIAVGLAAKIFVYDSLKQPTVVIAQAPPQTPSTAAPVSPAPAPKAVLPQPKPAPAPGPATELERRSEEYGIAARQLELIQDLMAKKEVKPSAGVLKVLKEIAEKTGGDTPAGVKARVLAAEIEDSLARQARTAAEPVANAPATPPVPPAVPTTTAEAPAATPGVSRPATPPAEKQPPAPENPATATPPQPPAKTAETPPAQPATPTPPAKAAEAPGTPPAAQPYAGSKLVAALRGLVQKAKVCQYADVSAELVKLTSGAEGDEKAAIEGYTGLEKREQELFKRCRKWLVDEIQKRPRHDSPLQVFPRRNEPGDDIVDFDETGLKIQEKRPAGVSTRTLPWEKTPAAQALALLQYSADKNSVEDQLGLAAFAFTRGLKGEVDAALTAVRALPGGRERAATFEEQLKQVGKVLEAPEK